MAAAGEQHEQRRRVIRAEARLHHERRHHLRRAIERRAWQRQRAEDRGASAIRVLGWEREAGRLLVLIQRDGRTVVLECPDPLPPGAAGGEAKRRGGP